MRRFASQAIGSLMEKFNFPEDMPIEHKLVSKAIESAQKQVESQNFEVRKNLLKYDDVMNKQREIIYDERNRLIEGSDFGEVARLWMEDTIVSAVRTFTNPDVYPEDWDLDELLAYVNQVYPVTVSVQDIDVEALTQEELIDILLEDVWEEYERREKEFGEDKMRDLERNVMLEIVDNKWREHLYELDYLQDGIGLRGIAGKDPLVAYQGEAFDMFQSMTAGVKEEFARYILHARMVEVDAGREPVQVVESSGEAEVKPEQRRKDKVGRNDPCPCGSGNKYKKCCGASV